MHPGGAGGGHGAQAAQGGHHREESDANVTEAQEEAAHAGEAIENPLRCDAPGLVDHSDGDGHPNNLAGGGNEEVLVVKMQVAGLGASRHSGRIRVMLKNARQKHHHTIVADAKAEPHDAVGKGLPPQRAAAAQVQDTDVLGMGRHLCEVQRLHVPLVVLGPLLHDDCRLLDAVHVHQPPGGLGEHEVPCNGGHQRGDRRHGGEDLPAGLLQHGPGRDVHIDASHRPEVLDVQQEGAAAGAG
mmetsp:Transcript_98317/g.234008  ORF Transcript_98317/g.234008 Transcript_98317/m.234008 type:complete len:242 (-) Transcript_98317:688-1413(-)